MRCPIDSQDRSDVLVAYCDGSLDAEAALRLERHLEQCPACREFRDAQQAVWDALDDWKAAPVTADFDRRLYRRIDVETRAGWWRSLFSPLGPLLARQGLPLAATVCLLAAAGIILEAPRKGAVAPPQPRVEAVQADQVERTLDDMELLRDFSVPAHRVNTDSNAM